ncbi:alpha/beta-hydrolase [Leucogyrophana mollusca]|uniref:Alpha/beta-hydrolase n=1 Tax=Leucogyrophana mollusca TaxID=85980 RepID=A0ACB8B5N8_9AGAM|nr:alpha/beta-hydrolase [Leucogyrophana mollusca]
MVYELRHQPYFGLYLTYQIITTTFVRVPYWFLVSTPVSWRPRPSWTVKRSVLVKFFRHLFRMTQKTGALTTFPTHHAITDGPGIKGVWVDGVPQLITGELTTWASVADVRPARIPGYWIDRDENLSAGAPPQPGDKVLYRLHGGAYIQLSAHPRDPTANIARGILKYCKSITRTFAIEYRLSTAAPYEVSNPFPAALLDAIAGYNYLVNVVGFSPADIIVQGDSAGGNLALAFIRYLLEYQQDTFVNLPAPPRALILLSPWSDIGSSHEGPLSSLSTHYSTDYSAGRSATRVSYAKSAFLGPFGFGIAERCRYISPASLNPCVRARFQGFPRTFLCAGGAEPLMDSILSLRWKMEADMGEGRSAGKIEYYEAADALHDFILFPWHEPEVGQTLERIAEWLSVEDS